MAGIGLHAEVVDFQAGVFDFHAGRLLGSLGRITFSFFLQSVESLSF
jgi:hypothetical protein